MSFEDAKQIVFDLADNKAKVGGLDDKFWVWETLEEATRPHVDEIAKEEIEKFHRGWALNFKGSEDLHDVI